MTKNYVKMNDPHNQRRNKNNVVFGTINETTDYHFIANYSINGKSIRKILQEQQDINDKTALKNEALVDIIKDLVERVKYLESKVREYGII